MLKKMNFLFVLISFSICLCIMSSTYSRYVAGTTGNIEVLFAKWQLLVNDNDITNSTSSTINFTPTILENENVKANTVAPSSKGYFDIKIDPTNVDVSFKYTINMNIANTNTPDLMITKYAILNNSYIEGDQLETTTLTDGTIANTLTFDKNNSTFKFESFTIRVYFEWYEGENEQMDDTEDTTTGKTAAVENTKLQMNATIKFEQII